MKKVLLHICASFVLLEAEAVNRENRKIEVETATGNNFNEKDQSFPVARYLNNNTTSQNEKSSNFSSNMSSEKLYNILNSSLIHINQDNHPNFILHLPYEYARSGNTSFSFRRGRSEDSDEPVSDEEEEMESLDNLYPEALRQSDDSFGASDSEQDYLTFSSIGDVYHDNSTYEEYDSVESLDDLEPSALIGENYDVEEVIENLDDLTAGALIANYLFEEDVDHPEKLPNASRLLKKQLYDLDHLLEGTGVNATVLLSAVDTLKNAGGLQNLLKATKGAHGFMSRISPTGGMTPLSPAGVNSLGQVGGAMKHKDMDEIRRELKTMLFSSENKMPVSPAYNQRPPSNLPRYSSPIPQRFGQPQNRPENPAGPPQNGNTHQQRKYHVVSSTGNRRNYPPAPPPVPPKNFHFGGYVKIHLPTIYQQIKGQKRKSDKGKGYQRPGYFQRNPITRAFKPSDRLDPKKDAFRPLPPPSRGDHNPYDANRRYMPANQSQRPQLAPNSPPYKRYDNGPIRTKENVGSQSEQRLSIETQRCDTFWENVCLEADVYPKEIIRNIFAKNKMTADILLADVKQQSADNLVEGVSQEEEKKYSYSHYYGTRRQGEDAHLHRDFANDGGYICPSDIIYGKPKRARNSKGIWKYVINFDDYTQTLRMEKCMKPGGSCSYLSPHFESQCSQLYNYQRLLSWDEKQGLHIDIYKVPSGCSCHIKGYSKYQERINTSRGKKRKISKYRTKTANRDDMTDNYGNFSNMDSVAEASPKPYPENRSEVMEYAKSRQRNKAYTSSSGRIGNVQDSESGRMNNEKSKVNYGYHPIIDFFQNYRFTAAR